MAHDGQSGATFILKKRADGSKYFVAAKDLSCGTVIFDEEPIFSIPYNGNIQTVCCLTCSATVTNSDQRCSVCGWPVCSEECSKLPIHRKNECKYFKKHCIEYDSDEMVSLSWIAAVIRGIMKKKNEPKIYGTMKNLGLSQIVEVQSRPSLQDLIPVFGKNLTEHFFSTKKLQNDLMNNINIGKFIFEKGLLRKLIIYNDSDSNDLGSSTINANGIYLYSKGSRMKHSCIPNLMCHIGDYPDFQLRVRAAGPIKENEELTLSKFTDWKQTCWGTIERREWILKEFGFLCECPRCLSPDELGSFTSAIRCCICRDELMKPLAILNCDFDENIGYYLPANPIAHPEDKNAPWQCNRCSRVTLLSALYPTIKILSDEIDKLKDDPNDIIDKAYKLEDLISRCARRVLHPNHFLIQRATLSFLQTTTLIAGQVFPKVDDVIKKSEYLLRIQDIIHPGFKLFKFQIAGLRRYRKLLQLAEDSSPSFSTFLKKRNLVVEMIIEQKRALDYFHELPSNRDKKESDQFSTLNTELAGLEQLLEQINKDIASYYVSSAPSKVVDKQLD